jgi:hypothetical protein
MLDASTIRYHNIISALNDLQTAGFSTAQITELVGLLNLWNGMSGAGGLNFGQGNGGSSGSGSRNNGNRNNRGTSRI